MDIDTDSTTVDPTPDEAPKPAPPKPAPSLDPERLMAELQAVRAEAAKYRVAAREAADERTKAQEAAELRAQELSQAQEARLAAQREAVAARYGLPDELASRLTGDDTDSLAADAEKLAKLLKPSRTPGTSPRNGGVVKVNTDDPIADESPQALAARILKRGPQRFAL